MSGRTDELNVSIDKLTGVIEILSEPYETFARRIPRQQAANLARDVKPAPRGAAACAVILYFRVRSSDETQARELTSVVRAFAPETACF
jgi:hypothetical protein